MTESEEPAKRVVQTVQELVQLTELIGIRCYETSAVLVDPPREKDEDPQGSIMQRGLTDPPGVESRFKLTVKTKRGTLTTDYGARYAFTEPLDVSENVLKEFYERVGVMALFPFVREAIFSAAARLGINRPVLGFLRPGDAKLGEQIPGEDEQVNE